MIVNTAHSPAQIRDQSSGAVQGRVCTIDARLISEETLGKNFPNTPMLAAAVKVSGVLEEAKFKKDMEDSFHHKFATKPQVVAGNMAALVQAVGGGTGRMIRRAKDIDEHTPWQEMTPGRRGL